MSKNYSPTISVVICVKNRSEYLRQALISLQLQTISDWECVVVDDYSIEDLEKVVNSLEDSRFIYVKNEGKPGISSSRNLGNSMARAEWIAAADSDDIYLPRRLALTLKVIADHPEVDVVHGNMYFIKDGTYEIKTVKGLQAYDRKLLYERNMISQITVAYRKSLVTEIKYSEDIETAEDYDLWLSFADSHLNFYYIEEPLALYRRHPEQESTDPEKLARLIENANMVLKRHPYFPE